MPPIAAMDKFLATTRDASESLDDAMRRLENLRISNPDWSTHIPVVIEPPYHIEAGNKLTDGWLVAFYKYVEEKRLGKSAVGAKSLRNLTIARAQEGLPELDNVPWTLIMQLWDASIKSATLSFQNWKVLSKQLSQEDNAVLAMFRYAHAIREPVSSLNTYILPMNSPRLEYITALSITVEFSVSELVKLCRLENLGVLELIATTSGADTENIKAQVSDQLVRSWAIEAGKNKCFRVLRILRLWDYKQVTRNCLPNISSFPSLAVFDVRGCGFIGEKRIERIAQTCGWKMTCDVNIVPTLRKECADKLAEKKLSHMKERSKSSGLNIWDGTPIRKVARSKLQEHLHRSNNSSDERDDSQINHLQDCYFSKRTLLGMPMDVRKDLEKANVDQEWTEIKWNLHSIAQMFPPCRSSWVEKAFASFSHIGELREDKDLMWAGVKGLDTQTFAGDEPISPVPMAAIQLGKTVPPEHVPGMCNCEALSGPSGKPDVRRVAPEKHGFIFFKLTWTRPSFNNGSENTKTLITGNIMDNNNGTRLRCVRRRKKQKLDVTLGSVSL